jgi:glycosyltransferase involved in cell wall biosynthesis
VNSPQRHEEHQEVPFISVVVPVRNEEGKIERCIRSLQQQSLEPDRYEVLVVDDGSTDGCGGAAERLGARVIRQDAAGAAAARNRGIREARGDFIVFTDADCVPDQDWLELLTRPLADFGVQGAVGQCTSPQTHWVARLIQLELDERYDRMRRHQQIDFLNTGNCGFQKSLLQANLFDESFRWLEDVELSFRLSRNGNRMLFVPEARVQHLHPESLRFYMKRKFRYATCASGIYRRFPGKLASDTRTPANKKLQLVLLGLALPALLAGCWKSPLLALGFFLLAASFLCSAPLILRASRTSMRLGLIAPLFVLLGNLAFLTGTAYGLLAQRGSNPK